MVNVQDKFTVEMVDPPKGWDDRQVDVRHRDISSDQIENAVTALLKLAHHCWVASGCEGRIPSVTVYKNTELTGQIDLPFPDVRGFSDFSEEKENFIAP
tara:strand:+ start:268 stop:564 length:297 start_codon:yes stop_codon:yes gene_type:complete